MSDIYCPEVRQFLVRLGGEIRASRGERHMPAIKVAELAASFGLPVHRVTLARIERGEQCPSLIQLFGLSKVLDVDWRGWVERAESDGNGIPAEGIPAERPRPNIEAFLASATELAQEVQLYRKG